MKDIKELALKVAKEMNWRMDEMTLETFATRLIAAYCEGQYPACYITQAETEDGFEYGYSASYPEAVHEHINDLIQRLVDNDIKPYVMHCVPLFTAPPEPAIQTCKPLLHVEKFSSDAAEKALVTPEDLLPAAGGSPAVFCPDTPLRKLFEDWVKRRAPIAEFTRNENGEYIVIGMHDEYLAFCAGSSVSIMESVAAPPEPAPQMPLGVSEGTATSACAAPSSEEVTKMVARLYGDLDGGPSSWLKQEAAAFIERLAARVDDLKQANDGLATAGILPDGCVVVPKEPTNEMIDAPRGFTQIIRGMTGCTFAQARAHCVNRGDNMLLWPEWARAEQGYVSEAAAALFIYQLMIAAGAVKP